MFASLFYRTQQYNKALKIIVYALSKCTFEKLCIFKRISDIEIEILSLKTVRKKGIVKALKILDVKCCNFKRNSFIIPTELQIKEDRCVHIIPAVVYAHFLRVLCHYHLKNISQCREGIKNLQLTIEEGYFIPDVHEVKDISYHWLGVAFQILDETDNAKKAFCNAFHLWPEPNLNYAFKRLS